METAFRAEDVERVVRRAQAARVRAKVELQASQAVVERQRDRIFALEASLARLRAELEEKALQVERQLVSMSQLVARKDQAVRLMRDRLMAATRRPATASAAVQAGKPALEFEAAVSVRWRDKAQLLRGVAAAGVAAARALAEDSARKRASLRVSRGYTVSAATTRRAALRVTSGCAEVRVRGDDGPVAAAVVAEARDHIAQLTDLVSALATQLLAEQRSSALLMPQVMRVMRSVESVSRAAQALDFDAEGPAFLARKSSLRRL